MERWLYPAVVLVTSHRDTEGPLAVLSDPKDSVGVAIDEPAVGSRYSFGSIIPCPFNLDNSDTVVSIRAISFESVVGSIRILGPDQRSLGGNSMIGSEEGFPPANGSLSPIDEVLVEFDCNSTDPATTEIVVGLELVDLDGGYVSGLVVEYEAGSESYELRSDVSFVLCGPATADFAERCE